MLRVPKLLLTSSGLSSNALREEFLRLAGKPPEALKVVFVPTAADPEPDKSFVADARKSIAAFQVTELDLKAVTPQELRIVLSLNDVLFMNGGNTFYLLHWARKAGLFGALNDFFARGGLYVGSSAGSIIAGPTIEVAAWKGVDDPSVVALENLEAANLLPEHIFPHYAEKWSHVVAQSRLTLKGELITLQDDEAVVIEGEDKRIIRK